jgi:hypothetical protein
MSRQLDRWQSAQLEDTAVAFDVLDLRGFNQRTAALMKAAVDPSLDSVAAAPAPVTRNGERLAQLVSDDLLELRRRGHSLSLRRCRARQQRPRLGGAGRHFRARPLFEPMTNPS